MATCPVCDAEVELADDAVEVAGSVHVFVRDAMGAWSLQAYVKPPNPGEFDYFGHAIALDSDAGTLAISAHRESSSATGIGGDQTDDSFVDAGAVYLY